MADNQRDDASQSSDKTNQNDKATNKAKKRIFGIGGISRKKTTFMRLKNKTMNTPPNTLPGPEQPTLLERATGQPTLLERARAIGQKPNVEPVPKPETEHVKANVPPTKPVRTSLSDATKPPETSQPTKSLSDKSDPMISVRDKAQPSKTGHPTSEKTGQPDSEKTGHPTSEKTGHPTSEKTGQPASEKTGQATSEKTPTTEPTRSTKLRIEKYKTMKPPKDEAVRPTKLDLGKSSASEEKKDKKGSAEKTKPASTREDEITALLEELGPCSDILGKDKKKGSTVYTEEDKEDMDDAEGVPPPVVEVKELLSPKYPKLEKLHDSSIFKARTRLKDDPDKPKTPSETLNEDLKRMKAENLKRTGSNSGKFNKNPFNKGSEVEEQTPTKGKDQVKRVKSEQTPYRNVPMSLSSIMETGVNSPSTAKAPVAKVPSTPTPTSLTPESAAVPRKTSPSKKLTLGSLLSSYTEGLGDDLKTPPKDYQAPSYLLFKSSYKKSLEPSEKEVRVIQRKGLQESDSSYVKWKQTFDPRPFGTSFEAGSPQLISDSSDDESVEEESFNVSTYVTMAEPKPYIAKISFYESDSDDTSDSGIELTSVIRKLQSKQAFVAVINTDTESGSSDDESDDFPEFDKSLMPEKHDNTHGLFIKTALKQKPAKESTAKLPFPNVKDWTKLANTKAIATLGGLMNKLAEKKAASRSLSVTSMSSSTSTKPSHSPAITRRNTDAGSIPKKLPPKDVTSSSGKKPLKYYGEMKPNKAVEKPSEIPEFLSPLPKRDRRISTESLKSTKSLFSPFMKKRNSMAGIDKRSKVNASSTSLATVPGGPGGLVSAVTVRRRKVSVKSAALNSGDTAETHKPTREMVVKKLVDKKAADKKPTKKRFGKGF